MNTELRKQIQSEIIATKERLVKQIDMATMTIDTALETLELLNSMTVPNSIPVKAASYAGMSVVEASLAYLRTVKEKKGTNEILQALTAGGIKCHYNTVYTLLHRRQEKVGDIKSTKGKWTLVEKLHSLAA